METHEAIKNRLLELMNTYDINEHQLALSSAVPQKTINSIFNDKSINTGILTIKKICDSFGITLREFFSTAEIDELEQEIK